MWCEQVSKDVKEERKNKKKKKKRKKKRRKKKRKEKKQKNSKVWWCKQETEEEKKKASKLKFNVQLSHASQSSVFWCILVCVCVLSFCVFLTSLCFVQPTMTMKVCG